MDEEHTKEEKEGVVRKFIQKLIDSGYTSNQRREIIRSGCTRFCRRQIEELTGGRQLYRSEGEMKSARKAKKFRNQYWFKSSRGGSQITAKKDLPFSVQEKELSKRQKLRRNRMKDKTETVKFELETDEEKTKEKTEKKSKKSKKSETSKKSKKTETESETEEDHKD